MISTVKKKNPTGKGKDINEGGRAILQRVKEVTLSLTYLR